MTNKKKKLARALKANGMSHQAAINVLNAKAIKPREVNVQTARLSERSSGLVKVSTER